MYPMLKFVLPSLFILVSASFALQADENKPIPKRDVIVVGNNWDGTIDIYDPHTYQPIKRLNAVPDKQQRLEEIYSGVVRRVASTFIREIIGEGNDQMVDDMFPV